METKITIFASKIITCVVLAVRYGKNGDFERPRVDFRGSREAGEVPNGSPNPYFLAQLSSAIVI